VKLRIAIIFSPTDTLRIISIGHNSLLSPDNFSTNYSLHFTVIIFYFIVNVNEPVEPQRLTLWLTDRSSLVAQSTFFFPSEAPPNCYQFFTKPFQRKGFGRMSQGAGP
jgi:hypothetical protein